VSSHTSIMLLIFLPILNIIVRQNIIKEKFYARKTTYFVKG